MSERREVGLLLAAASMCAAAVVASWCVSPWLAALLVSVTNGPVWVALFGMAAREAGWVGD